MAFDYHTLKALRKNHPAWKLLAADHAPLIVCFLHRAFILHNHRSMSRADLASALEDYLFAVRQTQGQDAFPKAAEAYLDDWAADEKGWLRKFYPQDSDEVHYDLMPWVEKAIDWLESLVSRSFIGTESRLMTIFELLDQIVHGSQDNAAQRIKSLEKQKAEIELKLELARQGHFDILDDTAVKDRFLQVQKTARELLSDFRQVEYNFRDLDRKIRERITLWEGSKGELLEDFFGERDMIADSDQGKSFTAFWDLLMSPQRQEQLTDLLSRVFELDAVRSLSPDLRLKRIHYDWLSAGEHTQRTVARLSGQLRRYLDDQAYLENKRIMQVIQSIEARGVQVKDDPPGNDFMGIDESAPAVFLPMERPLYTFPVRPVIKESVALGDGSDIPADILYSGVFVDRLKLKSRIRAALQAKDQVCLDEILDAHPLEHGLAELVAYLSIAGEDEKAVFDNNEIQKVIWTDDAGVSRRAKFCKVIFNR